MTLKHNLRDLFNRLELWFEATVGHIPFFTSRSKTDYHQDTPHLYKVCSRLPRFHRSTHIPEHVQFTTEQRDFPLPSPRYLEIHAACCRVAYMSGAAGYYRKLDDDDPFVSKYRSLDPVGSDFSAVLYARLLDMSEQRAATDVSG